MHWEISNQPMGSSDYIAAYYVDPDWGSDLNPGTSDRPFKTIQKSVEVAAANSNDGNQILLQGGTYNLTQPLEINTTGGTADAFLSIQPVPGEKAILDGSLIEQYRSLIDIRDVRRVNIIGLEIRNAPSHGIEVVNGKQINIVGNLIYQTQGMGIRVRGYTGENLQFEADSSVQSSDIVIENNGVYQTNLSNSGSNKGVDNWGAGIQAWNADDVVIVNNTVGENYGEGIGLTLVDDGVVANNRLYNNFSAQIYLDNVRESIVENNFIYNTGDRRFYRDDLPAHGLALGNEIHNVAEAEEYYLNDNLIRRNVIVGADSGIIYGTWAGTHQDQATNNFQGLRNTQIINNTVVDSQSYSIQFYRDSNTEDVLVANNIFFQQSDRNESAIDRLTGVNFGRNLWFGEDAGMSSNPEDIYADPLLANPDGRDLADYQLLPDSPAIDVVLENESYWITDNQGDLGALEFGEPGFEPGDIV
ncbi:MAG: right-handed parallel beta-helix repeat-containing protein [Cyanobacteria bacterium J06623_7]